MVLISLHDSMRRLETLLLAPEDKAEEEEVSSEEEDETKDQGAGYWQAFSKVEEYDDSGSDSQSSEEGETSDSKHRHSDQRPSLNARRASSRSRRRSSGLMSARRRSSYGLNEAVEKAVINLPNTTLDLPTRIARASSEYAALVFLRDRANAIGFSTFVAAHQSRWVRIRELLKDDLRKLIRMLTRYKGASLLVGTPSTSIDQGDFYRKMEKAELESWTPNAINTKQQKLEQTAWLESALTTWSQLPPTDPNQFVNGASEAEETIRAALVASWAQEVSEGSSASDQ